MNSILEKRRRTGSQQHDVDSNAEHSGRTADISLQPEDEEQLPVPVLGSDLGGHFAHDMVM